MALQAAAILLCSFFGGILADRWDQQKTMFYVEVIRGITLLFVPLSALLGWISIWVLIAVTIIVSSLKAFFDPTLRAYIPRLAVTPELRHSTNALMETTARLGKIIGPGLVGVLSRSVPVLHYFTIDAASFFVSALSIAGLKERVTKDIDTGFTKASVSERLRHGYKLCRSHSLINFIVLTDALVNSAWFFILPLAIGLLLHERMPDKVENLSLLVGSYGIGNLFGNVLIAHMNIRRFDLCLFWGRVLAGGGFMATACASNLSWMRVFAAIAAGGGPMTDIGKLTIIQRSFGSREIASIYRFSMGLTHSALLLVLILSPRLMGLFPTSSLITMAGGVMVFLGGFGLILFGKRTP